MPWDVYFYDRHRFELSGMPFILYQRHWETARSTSGPFIITHTFIKGFFIEPPGPYTTMRDCNLRIPPGKYNLTRNLGSKKGLRLYNDEVPYDRAILIHSGNEPFETKGCLLPGPGHSTDKVDKGSRELVDQIISWYNRCQGDAFILIFEL